MAFVFEELNETDKARYDWTMFRGWTGTMPGPPSHWSIDREKDIFFIWVQGPPRETDEFPMYALYWKGHVIRVEAQDGGTGSLDKGVDSVWVIRKIHIPPELHSLRADIVQTLKDVIQIEPINLFKPVARKSLTIRFDGDAE